MHTRIFKTNKRTSAIYDLQATQVFRRNENIKKGED